ncbi:helix-turn-helix transcriptional regulator [Vagococcus humatus]|uniref:AraC family transcriptional regulator n=1 Tax=Vagococcus humatus TaxID=1889241 RepID=A0A429Z6K4_9ENTE|nr:AraC family transcriptional regulator [Vagococcus humatus]RST89331.1 AraC family transcriptional regulator [Vagococcus humatus]
MYVNNQTFNPHILYAFDPWNEPNNESPLHQHDHLEFSIILEGESHYFIDNQNYSLMAGTVLLFNPQVVHGEQQHSGTYSHQLHIGIDNLFLTNLPKNRFPHSKAVLQLGAYHGVFLEKAWQVVQEINSDHLEARLMIKALITEMLVLVLRSLDATSNLDYLSPSLTSSDQRKQRLVEKTIYYLENHYQKEITLEQLAEKMFVSKTHLSKVFKEETDMSPINYLIHIRLRHAKELLHHDQLSVKEVAQIVGYEDAYHFSKLFKKYYGTSPSQIE